MSDTLRVAETFYSIQGEGIQAGTPMFFIRLAGCNADESFRCWDWCDTKYARGHTGTEVAVTDLAQSVPANVRWVCLTGGEPMLQRITPLARALDRVGVGLAVESNGTLPWAFLRQECKLWMTLSPKGPPMRSPWLADEIKWVIGDLHDAALVEEYLPAATLLQPRDNDPLALELCLDLLKEHPGWRLSLQLHKMIHVR